MKNNIQENIESSDYKDIKFKEFREYLYNNIKKSKLNKDNKEETKDRIQDLITKNGSDKFFGKMFYITLTELKKDIDIACEDLFHDYEYEGIKPTNKNNSKFSIFVSGISLNDADIANAIGASGSRVSRVRNNTDETDFYPYQVYALAKISNILASQLFDYFYGDGERPVIGLLPKPAEGKEN